MEILVRLMGRARLAADSRELILPLPEGATLAEALVELDRGRPELAALRGAYVTTREGETIGDEARLNDGDRLVLLPPVGGG